jgi:hypothetical protein
MAKMTFNMKEILFTTKLDLNVNDKLVNCYIWSIALYSAETWTFREVYQKYSAIFETWCWRGMEKIIWTDRARSEEVLHRVQENSYILHTMKRRANWIGHILHRNYLLKHNSEGNIEGGIEVTGRRAAVLL